MTVKKSRIGTWGTRIMPRILGLAAALLLATVQASAQSLLFDFEDGTDQGWGNKFSADSVNFPIVNIGGSNRMQVIQNGDFQEAEHNSGAAPFLAAMNAMTANPSVYRYSYDYYIDTSETPGNNGTFLQLGTYVNAGSGAYTEDFAVPRDLELNSAQLASGQVFQGTVSETWTQKYGAPAAGMLAQTFFRLGLIINGSGGNGQDQNPPPGIEVYFDNIRVEAIPEPASFALLALTAPAMFMRRRR
jgi:hypothetical protein